jgi:hypothetical protein
MIAGRAGPGRGVPAGQLVMLANMPGS